METLLSAELLVCIQDGAAGEVTWLGVLPDTIDDAVAWDLAGTCAPNVGLVDGGSDTLDCSAAEAVVLKLLSQGVAVGEMDKGVSRLRRVVARW